MSRYVGLVFAISLGMAATSPAFGQSQTCMKRVDLVRQLADRFQEAPIGLGIADNGSAVEVFVNPDGATWTLTMTMPNGLTCLLATGEHWENVLRKMPDRPA